MWNWTDHQATGTALPGGGGYRCEWDSAGAGQSCAELPQHHIQVRGLCVWVSFWRMIELWNVCHAGRKGTAEDLPFPDGSVDLITASSAAHYFDESKFMAEANRVLKPGGCIALMDFCLLKTRLHYRDCGERLNDIFQEVSFKKNQLFVHFKKLY